MLALTVLGAMAEKMNIMIKGSEHFFTSQIIVSSSAGRNMMGNSSSYLSQEQIDQLRAVVGVEVVIPVVNLMLHSGDQFDFNFGMPPMIQGVELGLPINYWSHLVVQSGEHLALGDRQQVVLGADLAIRYNARVGQPVILNNQEFHVKGILQKAMAGPDNLGFMSIEDGRELLLANQPLLTQLNEMSQAFQGLAMLGIKSDMLAQFETDLVPDVNTLAHSAAVIWNDDVDPELLAEKLSTTVEGIRVLSPGTMKEFISQAMVIINVIIFGSALIALIVGGLSVINTMMMSVSERVKEIGIKMAVGARPVQVMSEYLGEAAIISLIGGSLGLVAGSGLTQVINEVTMASSVQIFQVTPRLILVVLVFGISLGTIAGIYPAYRAAGLNCVDALKGE